MWKFRRRIHSSWLVAIWAFSFVFGVVMAPVLHLNRAFMIPWALTGLALCLFAVIRQKVWVISLVILGGSLIGIWRGSEVQNDLTMYTSLVDKTVQLEGRVSDDADKDKRGNVTVKLSSIRMNGRDLPGVMWVSFSKNVLVERSDRVTIQGKLNEGFGVYAGTIYHAKLLNVIRLSPGDVALHVRDWFADLIRRGIPDPEASLGIGYLVGQRNSLPEDLDAALRVAGLTHIVVASGYNLTILVRLARRLFEKVSKYLSVAVSGSLIVGFIAVTGLSPSMSRAGLVTGLSLLAWYYGRKFHPLVLLPITMAVTVFINPGFVWGDIGWQLSFAAFGGVMIFAPLLQAYYFGPKKPGIVRQILGETIAATLATAPIILYSFGYISIVAIPANLMILPLVPLAMLLTFITGIGVLLAPGIATTIGFPAQALLTYMTEIARFFGTIPWAKFELVITPWHVVGMYSLLVVLMLYMWWKTKLNLRDANLVE